MLIIRFFILFSAVFLLASCYQPRKNWPNYAQEAYLEQRAKRLSEPKPIEVNQQDEQDLFVVKEKTEYDPMWERKSYETVEQWIERINHLVALNQETVKLGKEELEGLTKKNRNLVERMQTLSRQSQVMKRKLIDKDALKQNMTTPVFTKELPFVIHFVEEGETLYGITLQYYEQRKKMTDVMRWNQGWIRNEDSLLAGLGLLLFPNKAKEKDPEAVHSYMEKIRWKNSKK